MAHINSLLIFAVARSTQTVLLTTQNGGDPTDLDTTKPSSQQHKMAIHEIHMRTALPIPLAGPTVERVVYSPKTGHF